MFSNDKGSYNNSKLKPRLEAEIQRLFTCSAVGDIFSQMLRKAHSIKFIFHCLSNSLTDLKSAPKLYHHYTACDLYPLYSFK